MGEESWLQAINRLLVKVPHAANSNELMRWDKIKDMQASLLPVLISVWWYATVLQGLFDERRKDIREKLL